MTPLQVCPPSHRCPRMALLRPRWWPGQAQFWLEDADASLPLQGMCPLPTQFTPARPDSPLPQAQEPAVTATWGLLCPRMGSGVSGGDGAGTVQPGAGKVLVSFIERQGHLGAAARQEAGGGAPGSLPVLEELFKDGALAALGQNLHLQAQRGVSGVRACLRGCRLRLGEGKEVGTGHPV